MPRFRLEAWRREVAQLQAAAVARRQNVIGVVSWPVGCAHVPEPPEPLDDGGPGIRVVIRSQLACAACDAAEELDRRNAEARRAVAEARVDLEAQRDEIERIARIRSSADAARDASRDESERAASRVHRPTPPVEGPGLRLTLNDLWRDIG